MPLVGAARQQIGSMLVRVVGLVGGRRAARRAAESLADRVEGRRRPHRLRSFAPADFAKPWPRDATSIDVASTGSALLLIHGINSSSHSCFRFTPEYVRALNARYGDRVFAFDHPSLCQSPEDNARWLAEQLRQASLANLDILAHSRGGLVARAFLNEKPESVRVRSLVFVGTPNGGTPLADKDYIGQLLSVVTNLVGLVPDNGFTDAIGVAIDALREFVLEGIGSLPGIAAMQEHSPVLTRLNGSQPPGVAMRAIASNYEPRSNEPTLHRLRDLVMDRIFLGHDNDLFVPTRSTYVKRDQFEIPVDQRLVLEPSFGVHHGTFWTEDGVLDRLDQWLDPAITVEGASAVDPRMTDPSAELDQAMATAEIDAIREAIGFAGSDELGMLIDIVGGPLPFTSRGTSAAKSPGLVVVLPGIMGSRLAVDGRTIWLGPWDLVRGRFKWLRIGGTEARPVELAGLMRQYVPLLAHLDRSWDVLPFPYDWRRSISDSAAQLDERLAAERERDNRPIHFVAHSMGGLVVRALFARDAATWKRAAGRVVQLGTPNWGSFAMPLAVCGDELLVRALALADVPTRKAEVLDTIASFPGVFDLFPSKTRALPGPNLDHEALYEAKRWRPQRSQGGATAARRRDGVPRAADGGQGRRPLRLRRRRRTSHAVPGAGRSQRRRQLRGDHAEATVESRTTWDTRTSASAMARSTSSTATTVT